ncbi:ATP-dependent DNA helicase RecG [Bacteroidia bacterium]|nr:ATP-dependent DNA helicase RecG [Bacteroidia bacterium]
MFSYLCTEKNITEIMIDTEKIKSLIAQGEGLNIEFKKSYADLSRDVYETICAFLNRKGGYILLGVNDNGIIEGVKEDSIPKQLKTLANETNNPQIIFSPVRLETDVVKIDEKQIICIYVPESSQAHSHKGIYYDRNHEGDYKLVNHFMISNLFLRKYGGHTEDRVFPHLRIDDFEDNEFDYVRKLVAVVKPGHPWIKMSNDEILRSAKMYQRDEQTGKEGYTLAAALVFGKPMALAMTCPNYKTDALCRKDDVDRYDDRDVVDCNLIQAYERLMAFIRKHTPDRFFLEGDRRKSIRDIIFREAVVNLLIHREFTYPYPATLTIYKETVVTENWNIPYMMGEITPNNLRPHPKNPNIAAFFRQLEWMDDLGSGVRKMFHYVPLYVKDKTALPIMEEGDVFKLTVRYEKKGAYPSRDLGEISATIKHADEVLELIQKNPKITIPEMAQNLSLNTRTIDRVIGKLVEEKIIEREGSRKEGKWMIL